MKEYRVEWVIQLSAKSPRHAAKQALAIQRDVFSSSTVFDIYREDNGKCVTVDLDEATDESNDQKPLTNKRGKK